MNLPSQLQAIQSLDLSDIDDQYRLYNLGQYQNLREKLEQLLEAIPIAEPTCTGCGRLYTRCNCTI